MRRNWKESGGLEGYLLKNKYNKLGLHLFFLIRGITVNPPYNGTLARQNLLCNGKFQ